MCKFTADTHRREGKMVQPGAGSILSGRMKLYAQNSAIHAVSFLLCSAECAVSDRPLPHPAPELQLT